MEKIDSTNVLGIGNSLYFRIPKPACVDMGFVKGTPLDIFREGDMILFSKVKEVVHANVVERDEPEKLK